jgi:hypothetical protein
VVLGCRRAGLRRRGSRTTVPASHATNEALIFDEFVPGAGDDRPRERSGLASSSSVSPALDLPVELASARDAARPSPSPCLVPSAWCRCQRRPRHPSKRPRWRPRLRAASTTASAWAMATGWVAGVVC